MRKTLEKLQNMPEHKKRLTAFLGASIITGVIFAVWLTATIESIPSALATNQKTTTSNQPSPVDALKTNVAGAYVGFQNMISTIKDQFDNLNFGGSGTSSIETQNTVVDNSGEVVSIPDKGSLIFTK